MKRGLVLEGGAMRGMFTAGVIDVMMEENIIFDGAVGVSAGAAFGCNYKSKQIGRAIRYNMQFCNDKRYCGLRSLITTGNIYSTDFCYGEVPLKYDIFDFDTYKNNPMEFYVVCTDVESGKPYYRNYKSYDDNDFDWIRASASMPLVSKIVPIEGKKYLDGGISDSIPLKFLESKGYDKNIVILTQPKGYTKKKNSAMAFAKIIYHKYPNFIESMANRHLMYNKTLEYIAKKDGDGTVFAIYPPFPLPVGKMEKDANKLKAVYEIGRKTATEKLDDIKKFLQI